MSDVGTPILLTRDAFRTAVFERDQYRCVLCEKPAADAHHILDRRLWPDEGYYLENGASVCPEHHILCEQTVVSCEELRERCGITHAILPPHLYDDGDSHYDKWGNPILSNGMRMRGELFFDESVQKVLVEGRVLGLFTQYVKYPRTYHLPWSPGVTKDDRVQTDLSAFKGQEVVATVKMDGENTTFYRNYIHARSLEYRPRVDRDRVKALHAVLSHEIPYGWRICGENLWAEHSIRYEHLPSIFQVFSVWDDQNHCLPWDETVEWVAMLDLHMVPVLYRGPWDEARVRSLYVPTFQDEACEGFVIRVTAGFRYGEFRRKVAKYVREGHVRTQAHWTRSIRPNGLRIDTEGKETPHV
jgi:hypothetical protein